MTDTKHGFLGRLRQMLLDNPEERQSVLLTLLHDKELLDQERFSSIRRQLNEISGLLRASQPHQILPVLDERSQSAQAFLSDGLALTRISELRSRTLEHQGRLSLFGIEHLADLVQKWYIETAPGNPAYVANTTIAGCAAVDLLTERPIALDSNDHLTPDSTAEGIGRPTHYVRHCIDVLGQDISVLDIGTGAAGVVYEFLMNSVQAFGIDGSDYCRRNRVGYWPLLPHSLKTADITHPFRFENGGKQLKFRLISAWEVLEHIPEEGLGALFSNISAQLTDDGYFIGSVSLLEYNDPTGRPYHVTLKPREWWVEAFASGGLEWLDTHPFNARLFPRGNGPRFQDVHNYFANPETGFHFVARKTAT